MSWLDETMPIFRTLIGDDENPCSYSDDRLSDVLFCTAKLLLLDISFETSYVVTISTQTIDPDPMNDPYFIPLLALKAATKVANSEYRAASLSAGSVVDGPSTINLGQSATALKSRAEALQKEYENAKVQYAIGNAVGCQAVLSTCRNMCEDNYRTYWNNYRNIEFY